QTLFSSPPLSGRTRRRVLGHEPDLTVGRVAERLVLRVAAAAENDGAAGRDLERHLVGIDDRDRAGELERPIRPHLNRDVAHAATLARSGAGLESIARWGFASAS